MNNKETSFYQWLTLTKQYIDNKQLDKELGEALIESQISKINYSSMISFFEYIDNRHETREQTNYWAEKLYNKKDFQKLLFINLPTEQLYNATLLKWQIEKVLTLPIEEKKKIYRKNLAVIKKSNNLLNKNNIVYIGRNAEESLPLDYHYNIYSSYKKIINDSRIKSEDKSQKIIEDMEDLFNKEELEILLVPQLFKVNDLNWCLENLKKYNVFENDNLTKIFASRFIENKTVNIESFIEAVKGGVPKDLMIDNKTIIDIYLRQELTYLADSLNTDFNKSYKNEQRTEKIEQLTTNLNKLKEFGLEFVNKENLELFNKRVNIKKIEGVPQNHNDYLIVTLLLEKFDEKTIKRKVLKV